MTTSDDRREPAWREAEESGAAVDYGTFCAGWDAALSTRPAPLTHTLDDHCPLCFGVCGGGDAAALPAGDEALRSKLDKMHRWTFGTEGEFTKEVARELCDQITDALASRPSSPQAGDKRADKINGFNFPLPLSYEDQHNLEYRTPAQVADERGALIAALCRLLEGDGHMTPVATRQILAALESDGQEGK